MPLPLNPVVMFALRTGVVAVAVWALRQGAGPGRTDQRAEDALDDTDEGLALHRPGDRDGQTNAALRLRRTFHFGGGGVELDAAMLARLRVRRF